MKKLFFPNWTPPIALLVICIISFGVMANKLGFYWDGWFTAYYIHFLGPSSFLEALTSDPPLQGWIAMLSASIVGESAINWQIFGIVARWLTCLALWWALIGLWPGKLLQVTAISFLFAVYPGFQQQYVAFVFGNFFIFYALYMSSLGAMIWAFRKSNWFWWLFPLSIALSGFSMFASEYFLGLELLRPIILWVIPSNYIPDLRKRMKRIGFYWFPNVILMVLSLVWRATTETPRGKITILTELGTNPIYAIQELGQTIIQDFIKTSFQAWGQTLKFSTILFYDPMVVLKYSVISLVTALLVIYYLANLRYIHNQESECNDKRQRPWSLQAIIIGTYSLFIAGIPFWTTSLQISLSFSRDRFTLPFMLGTSILFIGLIEALPKFTRLQNIIIVGVAVGLATGMHFQTALLYYREWLDQKNFFWQLTWRAPDLQPGTIILVSEIPFPYDSDNSLTPPLNWIYAPENTSTEFPYLYYNVESHLTRNLPTLSDNMPIKIQWRLTNFEGTLSRAIFIIYRDQSCLKVVDPIIDRSLPEKPRFFREILPFSKPDLILPGATPAKQPPYYLFGPEPAHDWCYHFEKAELARQQGDWQEIAKIGDQAFSNGKKFYRRNVAELAPFIEGYTRLGQWEKATKLSIEAYESWENMRFLVCDIWNRAYQASQLNTQGLEAYKEIQQVLICSKP